MKFYYVAFLLMTSFLVCPVHLCYTGCGARSGTDGSTGMKFYYVAFLLMTFFCYVLIHLCCTGCGTRPGRRNCFVATLVCDFIACSFEQMLSYKLSITTQNFLNILNWFEERRNTTDNGAVRKLKILSRTSSKSDAFLFYNETPLL
jgi:hypothetical protein